MRSAAPTFRGGKTPYDHPDVTLKVTDGTAHAQDVRIESPALRIGVAGTTSIPSRAFDLKGTASLFAAAPPTPSNCRSW